MTQAIQRNGAAPLSSLDEGTMLALVSGGDCSKLTPAQKTAYFVSRCEAAGLDPRAQPFAFVRLNGKEVLYAQKAAADQLASKHGVRLQIVSQATEDGIRIVTVRAEARDGRVTEEIGALPIKGLTGEALSNALMKCVTKAKRRAILSLCGLGMLDESEVESIPAAVVAPPLAPPMEAQRVEMVKPHATEIASLEADIQNASTAAELAALIPEIKALPADEQARLRPLYAARRQELTNA